MGETIEGSCMLGHCQVDNLAGVSQDLSSPRQVHGEKQDQCDLQMWGHSYLFHLLILRAPL